MPASVVSAFHSHYNNPMKLVVETQPSLELRKLVFGELLFPLRWPSHAMGGQGWVTPPAPTHAPCAQALGPAFPLMCSHWPWTPLLFTTLTHRQWHTRS